MDVYRIEEADGTIGFDDYFNKSAISIIEWAEMIEDELPSERLELIFRVIDENTRVIIFKPFGSKYEDLVSSVL